MAICHPTELQERDVAEINRSAEEARSYVFRPVSRPQLERYLSPPADTPYSLEYAYYLLGDVRGKTVLDLGCGKGENLVPLAYRGANVIGLDLSPELVSVAQTRVASSGVKANVLVASAYQTGLPSESVDVIFCAALIHHLEIPRVRMEMLRVLKRDGFIVLVEPIRFSQSYDRLRRLLRLRRNVSEYEHPLTKSEVESMSAGLKTDGVRYFRLPFVPLFRRMGGPAKHFSVVLSGRLINRFPALRDSATLVALRLRK